MAKKTKDAPPKLVGLAEHPRASAGIRRTKAWGGLAGFCAAGAGGYLHGAPMFDAGLAALGGGLVAYFVAWSAAVAAWRHLVAAEARVVASKLAAAYRGEEPEAS
jgi:hypothetical protein